MIFFKRKEKRSLDEFQNPINGTLSFNSFSSYTASKSMKLSTVYRCVDIISNAVASMPLIDYKLSNEWFYEDTESELYNVLNVQPNNFFSGFRFKKLMVQNILLKGAAYILLEKDTNGRVIGQTLLNSDNIRVDVVDNDIKYTHLITNKVYDKSQIVTILNYSEDGITGQSTISYAATALGIAYDTDTNAANFFKGGSNLSGILRPSTGANISAEKAKQAKASFIAATASNVNGAVGNGVVVLDSGLEYQPISVNPRDSQLLESRQFNVIEICRFFGVNPSLVYGGTNSYASAEMAQIDFLTSTLQPLLENIENEYFRKIYLKSEFYNHQLKFDTTNLLRLDAQTQATVLNSYLQSGVYNVNEVRQMLNAKQPVKGGNRNYVAQNLQPLDNNLNDIKSQNNNTNNEQQ